MADGLPLALINQIGQSSQGPFGPDLKQMLTLQNLGMQTRLAQEEQQGRNTLRQLYGNPQFLDPKTNTLNQLGQQRLMQVSPNVGLDYAKFLSQDATRRAQQEGRNAVLTKLRDKEMSDLAVSARNYELDRIREGKDPQTAIDMTTREIWGPGIDRLKSSGYCSTADCARLSSTYNPSVVQANEAVRKAQMEQAKADIAERREQRQETRADVATAQGAEHLAQGAQRIDLEKRRFDLDAQTRGMGTPEPVEVTKTDGSKSTETAVYDKQTQRWLNSQGGAPLEGQVRQLGRPSAGSTQPGAVALKKYLEENPQATAEDIQRFNQRSRVPRSGQAAAVQRYMEEHPDATSDDIAREVARVSARVSAARAVLSGPQGNAIRSFSVADSHLDTMQKLGDALGNNDIQAVNTLKNTIKTQFGYEGPVDFDFARRIVGAEVAKAIIGGAGTGEERKALQDDFNKALSPTQLSGVIRTARSLIGGQLEGYRRQFQDVVTPEEFDRMLSPSAQRDLPLPGAAAGAAPSPAAPAAANRVTALPGEAGDKQWADAPSGTIFVRDGKEYRKP